MIAVGLCGLAGAGKDTAADQLVEHHGFVRIAFAEALKNAAYALDPLVSTDSPGHQTHHTCRLATLVDLLGWDNAKRLPDVRRTLQRMGTEVGREQFGADFWVERAMTRAIGFDRVVFTDLRFGNEAEAVRALGGSVVFIERPGLQKLSGITAHVSEDFTFNVDATITNNYTPETLGQALWGYLEERHG